MNYSKITTDNKNFIKRFSHHQRFIVCRDIIKKYQYRSLLDYGAGNGQLVKLLSKSYSFFFHLYEPDKKQIIELKKNLKGIKKKIFNEQKKLKSRYYDIICVNEVFEHLSPLSINRTIEILKRITKKNGIIVISVPIEVGLSSLLKNIVRILINEAHTDTNLINIIKSLFFLKIKRPNLLYNPSHIGFNYIEFIQILKKNNFNIKKISYSPFDKLKGFINSQVYIETNFK